MKNFFIYLFSVFLFLGCTENKGTAPQKEVTAPTKVDGAINWAFFNTDGLENISFPIWFNDTVILNSGIEKIHFSVNEFEPTEDSIFQDTIPSSIYEVSYSKNGVNLFYVKKFAEEIKIEEQWFRYRKSIDSLGYSLASVTNDVIYEENDFLPIFSTLQNAQQYKRLKFQEIDSSIIQYINTLNAEKEKHIFITDSTHWNVHYIDQNFENPEKNTFYYGLPNKYHESFKVKNLVEKEQLASYKYFDNGCLYQQSTFSNGFEKRRTYLYDKAGRIESYVDSLIVEPNDFIESVISKINYVDGLPVRIASYKAQDSLHTVPLKEIIFDYTFSE